jgi:hypothetical protein
MGGTGSGGYRATSGRKTKLDAARRTLGRAQSTMHSFTTRDPKVVEKERKQQEEARLADEATAEAKRQASIATAVEQAKIQDENRRRAIENLKKVMGDGGLEESLDSLPDDPNDAEEEGDESEDDEASPSRLSTAYKPPKDSPLFNYLKGIKDEILDGGTDLRKMVFGGQHFIPPRVDPMIPASIPSINAEPWYISNVWVFFWDPFIQHNLKMKTYKCPCCGRTHVIEAKE